MKDYADIGGCYPPRPSITPSEICIILPILRKQNLLIALLFIQNNSQFKNKLKHSYLRRCYFHLDSACSEDKGLFRSANILQIADVVRRIVFLVCFWTIVRRETSKMFRQLFGHFSFHNQNNSICPQVFWVNSALTCNCAALLTSSVD